jgi:hypothetical protein
MFEPEMVVKVAIQKGSVHVEENGVYVVPVNKHRGSG